MTITTVLLISPRFLPETNAQALAVAKLANGLIDQGLRVIVLSSRIETTASNEIKESNILGASPNLSVVSAKGRLNGALGRFTNWFCGLREYRWVRSALPLARRIIKEEKPQWIMSFAHPIEAHILGLHIKKEFNSLPWIAHYSDPWSENPFYRFSWPAAEYLRRLIERPILKRCDFISANTGQAGDSIARYCKEAAPKVIRIPNCFSKRLIDHALNSGTISSRTNTGKLIVSHFGSLIRRTPKLVLDATEILSTRLPNLNRTMVMRFYGPENGQDEWVHRINQIVPGLAQSMGHISYDDSIREMRTSDLLLVMDAEKKWSPFMPSKLADYYGVGGTILAITPRGSSTEDIINKYGGRVVHTDDAYGLCLAFASFIEKKEKAIPLIDEMNNGLGSITDFEASFIANQIMNLVSSRR